MRYLVYGATVTSDIELPGAPHTLRKGGIVIERGHPFDGRPIEPFQERRVPGARRRRPWLSIAREDGGYVLRFPDQADFVVSHAGERIVYRPRPRLATSTLSHLLLDHVLPLAISRREPLALHASAVHVSRLGTIAFVGPTGSGKSTLAAAMALAGCDLVTDDCLVVNPRSGCIAAPGYDGLRLWHDAARGLNLSFKSHAATRVAHYSTKRRLMHDAMRFRRTPSPIAAVFVLGRRRRKALPTRATPLAAHERLMALASCVYVLDIEDRRQLAAMFRGLTTLVATVPIVRLSIPDGGRQVRQAADEVLAIARSASRQ